MSSLCSAARQVWLKPWQHLTTVAAAAPCHSTTLSVRSSIVGPSSMLIQRRGLTTTTAPPSVLSAGLARQQQEHALALEDPSAYWLANAKQRISWSSPPSIGLEHPQGARPASDLDGGNFRLSSWFPDGELNMCYNCVDRHVESGRGSEVAIIHDTPLMGGRQNTITYQHLQEQVSRVANGLKSLGVRKGDTVVIYMGMAPELMYTVLACARLGATYCVVFGGFAAHELATRITSTSPAVLVTADYGVEPNRVVPLSKIVREALTQTPHAPRHCVQLRRFEDIPQPLQNQVHPDERPSEWVDFATLVAAADSVCAPVPVPSTHPLYVLHTSGTTGLPKGVTRDTGGYATALAWSIENIFDIRAGQTMATLADLGWVVGQSYALFAPLLAGATTILYEGKPVGTPDAGAFWRLAADHGVRTMFTAPTALRAVRSQDANADMLLKYARERDLSQLRTLFIAGERCDPPTLQWMEAGFARAWGNAEPPTVVDHMWMTESGWPITAACVGLGNRQTRHGASNHPVPGWNVRILDTQDPVLEKPMPTNTLGAMMVKLPLPPGALTGLWGAPERFNHYFAASHGTCFQTGDVAFADELGMVHVMAREDDVIQVAGHRLSTGALEEALGAHELVAESAVLAYPDDIKGFVPMALVVLKTGVLAPDAFHLPDTQPKLQEFEAKLVQHVREYVGPVAALHTVVFVPGLPKTRSGKVLRGTLRHLARGDKVKVPPTVEEIGVLEDALEALRKHGFAQGAEILKA